MQTENSAEPTKVSGEEELIYKRLDLPGEMNIGILISLTALMVAAAFFYPYFEVGFRGYGLMGTLTLLVAGIGCYLMLSRSSEDSHDGRCRKRIGAHAVTVALFYQLVIIVIQLANGTVDLYTNQVIQRSANVVSALAKVDAKGAKEMAEKFGFIGSYDEDWNFSLTHKIANEGNCRNLLANIADAHLISIRGEGGNYGAIPTDEKTIAELCGGKEITMKFDFSESK